MEDSEQDKTPVQTRKIEYKQEDRLFIIRILLESTMEDICTTSMTSQKLIEGAHHSSEV